MMDRKPPEDLEDDSERQGFGGICRSLPVGFLPLDSGSTKTNSPDNISHNCKTNKKVQCTYTTHPIQ